MLLFDEPLSNLDAKLRADMRIELRELQHRLGITSLYVTHDLEEALAMSDRIVVMRDGLIEQTGTPDEIYSLPRSDFVADFVGSANLIRGHMRPDLAGDGSIAVEFEQRIDRLWHHAWASLCDGRAYRCARGILSLHSERPAGDRNIWPVSVHRSIFLGDLTQVHVRWDDRELIVRQSGMKPWVDGQPAYLSADPRHCVLLESI